MNARGRSAALAAALAAGGGLSLPRAQAQRTAAVQQRTFASPEQAAEALRAAAGIGDKPALYNIFGAELLGMLTGDEAQDNADARKIAAAIEESAAARSDGPGRVYLEIGANRWAFPIPLVKTAAAWRFDAAAGKEEIINRHIGKEELRAIGLCRAYARARRQDGGVPIPDPAHGYHFKALSRQAGFHIGGFAMAAYPEHWGRSGIMTFIVNQDGRIYQRDFGQKTSLLASGLSEFDPDASWTLTED